MIRYMSSAVRTARQNINQKPLSTSSVKFIDIEKKLEKLREEQMRIQMDPRPTYLKNNTLFFGATCLLGLVSMGMAVQTMYRLFKTY